MTSLSRASLLSPILVSQAANFCELYLEIPDKYQAVRTILVSLLASLKTDLQQTQPLTREKHAQLILRYHLEYVKFVHLVAKKEYRQSLREDGFLAFLLRLHPRRVLALHTVSKELSAVYRYYRLT